MTRMKRTYRLLHVFFRYPSQIRPLHHWFYLNQHVLSRYCIRTVFTHGRAFRMMLYGYDMKMKWSSEKITDLRDIITIVRRMPMADDVLCGRENDGVSLCGLPKTRETSHCFRDETHRTCCLLGGQARRYADRSGNPIGRAAEQAFHDYYGFYPDEKTLTPWCTCIGSEACTFYTNMFQDGTHINYIDTPRHGKIFHGQEKKYKTLAHRTPGVHTN